MKVRELMTDHVESCSPDTDLGDAAMIMWRNDCGVVPVTDRGTRRLAGVITDRDICMGLATSGRRPSERRVEEIMARTPITVGPGADVHRALEAMRRDKVRRLPVVDANGDLVGMLSINDVILRAERSSHRAGTAISADDVIQALKAICEHRGDVALENVEEELAAGAAR